MGPPMLGTEPHHFHACIASNADMARLGIAALNTASSEVAIAKLLRIVFNRERLPSSFILKC